jgi:hypothetical protein
MKGGEGDRNSGHGNTTVWVVVIKHIKILSYDGEAHP